MAPKTGFRIPSNTKDEKCPDCGTTFLSCVHFIMCAADDCPMKSSDKRSLLDQMFGEEEKNG